MIGVITKVIDDDNVEIIFPTNGNIIKMNIQKITINFEINGTHALKCQFQLQNAFAKTQGMTKVSG